MPSVDSKCETHLFRHLKNKLLRCASSSTRVLHAYRVNPSCAIIKRMVLGFTRNDNRIFYSQQAKPTYLKPAQLAVIKRWKGRKICQRWNNNKSSSNCSPSVFCEFSTSNKGNSSVKTKHSEKFIIFLLF